MGVQEPIPEDFPRDPFPAAVPGAQPKFVARKIDGRYVVGLTEQERRERYEACLDLVEWLTGYTEKKYRQFSGVPIEALLDKFDRDIRLKDWGLSSVEFDWIMAQLRARFISVERALTTASHAVANVRARAARTRRCMHPFLLRLWGQ
ncbi:MAG: hypothetical protein V4627_15790 [Pseudomonadota bacterium]